MLTEHTLGSLGARQHNLMIKVPPKRGNIFDRNLKEFAMNLKVPSIFAIPRLMDEKKDIAKRLAKILGRDRDFILNRIERDKSFIWLKRNVTPQEAENIQKLKDSSLGIIYENKRFYPNGEMLANVLGFCDVDNQGIEGIEMLYDKHLEGSSGYRVTKRDALGREVVAFEEKAIPAVDGHDVVLTVDHFIQYLTERSLDETFVKYKAKGAIAIVMNPQTGEILAMANRPTYDPNKVGEKSSDVRRNRAITDIFEPGSVFKIITASAALAEKKVSITDKFNCENGEWHVTKSRTIHDVHKYGILTFPEVIQNSSNIGTVKIAMKLGQEPLYNYIKKFKFGETTGIDLQGEVAGILHPLSKWSKVSIMAVPYGQEVSATALQMVSAISVIANGGHLMTPFVVKEIQDEKHVTLKKTEPHIRETIIEPAVASTMNDILQMVVESGTGKSAQIEGIKVAGKTGTAQKLEGGTYSHSHFISSFIGYAPADDPKLAMIVAVDDPRGAYYGGVVAAPVFKAVVEESLYYMGYVPQGTKLAMPELEGSVDAVPAVDAPPPVDTAAAPKPAAAH